MKIKLLLITLLSVASTYAQTYVGSVSSVPPYLVRQSEYVANGNQIQFSSINDNQGNCIYSNGFLNAMTVDVCGGIYPPTLITNTANPMALDIGAFDAVVIIHGTTNYAHYAEKWHFAGTNKYFPQFTAPSSSVQQATFPVIVPDLSTKDTTKTLKIVECNTYRDVTPDDAEHCVYYMTLARDAQGSNLTTVVPYMPGFRGANGGDKIKMMLVGCEKLGSDSYKITIETNIPVGLTGCYFRVNVGSASKSGGNYLNDPLDTYTVVDGSITGGTSSCRSSMLSRSLVGDDGKQNWRQTGALARMICSSNPIFEATAGVYTPITPSGTKWVCYKLFVFPGSRILLFAPSVAEYNDATDVNAIGETHIFELANFSRFWTSVHVGYFTCRNDFVPTASWASNAGKYHFYSVSKIEYTP